MPRSSWNKNSPDVVGVEFQGVGVASNIVQLEGSHRAVRFVAQQSGPINQIAVYCGPFTFNPVRTETHFAGHRTPFIIDLYPASGFDATPLSSITYPGTPDSWSNVIDDDGSAIDGDELQFAWDGKFMLPGGSGTPIARVHMPDAATFPLTHHVHSIRVDLNVLAPVTVTRRDQGSTFLWGKTLSSSAFMSEVRIESGSTSAYRAWTPSEIRQFAAAVGNRRMQLQGFFGQTNVFDQLGITVFYIPEKRAGTAIIEPPGPWQWTTANMHLPGVTGSPAMVTAGGEYILLYRVPGGPQDFGSSAIWDACSIKDRRLGNSPVHFTDLTWDSYSVTQQGPIQTALNELLDGLPPVRLINGTSQTVDTQPYEFTAPVIPFYNTDSRKVRQSMSMPAGTTEYNKVRLNVALLKHLGPADKKRIFVEVVNNADALIAGPFEINPTIWDAAPPIGNDIYGDEYRQITLDFGTGIDINEAGGVNTKVYLDPTYTGSIAWRVQALFSSVAPVTGSDQTAVIAATGWGFFPPTNAFVNLNNPGVHRADLQISLLSQAPEITGIGVTGSVQAITGGPCDPCGDSDLARCQASGIPYHHVCWPQTTLTQEKFGYYELQRQEPAVSTDWLTIAIIAPTGTPVSGAPVTGVPRCFDDYTHVYDTQVCYRVRQQRVDGTLSDFVDQACITTTSPDGAGLIITAQDDPSFNLALPDVYSDRLPVEREWTNLDADQLELRAVYGRDNFLAFRPTEKLGLRFERRLMVSGLCTVDYPCLSVAQGIRDVTTAPVSYLVVRDRCGNRWYAAVTVPTITQMTDPTVGDLWFVDIVVTEVATPVFEAST